MYFGPEPLFGWMTRWSLQTATVAALLALVGGLLVWRASRRLRWVWVPSVLVVTCGVLLYGIPETRSYRADRAKDALTEFVASLGWPPVAWSTEDFACPWDTDVGARASGSWPVPDDAARDSIVEDLRRARLKVWESQGQWTGGGTRDGVHVEVSGAYDEMTATATYGC